MKGILRMNKITAFIWAYNEENRIAKVVNMLSEFDDIIVFDKSSTDRTKEIAEKIGVRVVNVPYSDNAPTDEAKSIMLKALYELEDNEWVFSVVCSDIIHWKLYQEMVDAIDAIGDKFQVIEVPIYRYSMGICGKNSHFGDLKYQSDLFTRAALKGKYARHTIVHEDPFEEYPKYRLLCREPEVAVYHLTHENLELVLERHTRYAKQYVQDQKESGKSKEAIMKYSWHEMVRTILFFFRHRVFKMKWTGLAQCMTLLMYNAMIYLNAFFDDEQETEIKGLYDEIGEKCKKH